MMDTFPRRIKAVRDWIVAKGLDGVVLVPGANLQYLTGYRGSVKLVPYDPTRISETMIPTRDFTALLLGRSSPPLFFSARSREAEAIRRATSSLDVVAADTTDLVESLRAAFVRCGMLEGTVGVDEQTWWGVTAFLQNAGVVSRVVNASGTLYQLRGMKDDQEINALRRAGEVARAGFAAGFSAARPGISESELSSIVIDAVQTAGGELHGVVVISGGKRIPEVTTARRLEVGDPLLIDINASYEGYFTDITRLGACGADNPKLADVHRLLVRAQEAAQRAASPGVTTGEIDRAGRQVLEDAGLGKAFTHGIGHGVGLSDHEGPWLNPGNPTQAYQGMVHTLEPSVYLPEFNARLEDVFVMTGEGCEWLPTWPRELTITPLS